MEFKNPWGKGAAQHDKWFDDTWGKDAAVQSTILRQGQPNTKTLDTQVLSVPYKQNPDPGWLRYKVKNGESFDSIAMKFGLTVTADDLAFWNDKAYSDPSEPHAGDTLALPFITEEDLDNIETDLDEMSTKAQQKGWFVAIDNLNRFRDGVGGVKEMDTAWLKSFEAVTDAINDIQAHFHEALSNISNEMTDGESISGDGRSKQTGNQYWWEGFIVVPYMPPAEISMACGNSTLTGVGVITLTRTGDNVSIAGEVEFQFYDPYDWKGGDSVPIGFSWGQAFVFPIMGAPFEEWPDSNMILLEEFRGAAEFIMSATWKQKVQGTISVGFWSNEINLTWSDT